MTMRARPIAVGVLAVALLFPLAASADLASEVQEGQQLAEAVRSGDRKCSELSGDELDLIGEYAMDRYLGSTSAHEAMNRHMTLAMGEAGERRMHIALGNRYSDCGGGPASRWIGPMAGMMFGEGGSRGQGHSPGSGGYGPGMMGGYGSNGYPSSMMGGPGDDSDVSTWGVVLIALASALVGGGVAALLMHRRAG